MSHLDGQEFAAPSFVERELHLAKLLRGERRFVALVGLLLGGIALLQTIWSLGVVFAPEQFDAGEGVVYYHAGRIGRGEPLYQPLDRAPFTVAGYTPLYYTLAGWLQQLLGPGFWPGRALSFVSGLITALLVAHLTRQRTGSGRAGLFASALFLSLGLPAVYLWSALYRVDLLGIAFSLGAVTLLTGGSSTRRLVLAGLLAGVAILTKQTLLAATLAGALWLLRLDWRRALIFAGVSIGLAGLVCLALDRATGAFLLNTVAANLNPLGLDVFASNLVVFAIFQIGPLALAAAYLRDRWRSALPSSAGRAIRDTLLLTIRAKRFWNDDCLLGLYWLFALLPIVGLAKVGASQNYWIEFAAITAILATAGLWEQTGAALSARLRTLGVNVAAGLTMIVVVAAPVTKWIAESAGWQAELQSLVERVRAEPGQVLADPLDVVALAARPVLLEPYIYSILHLQGYWDPAPVAEQICSGQVSLLILSYPLDGAGPLSFGAVPRWPGPVLKALRQTMSLESRPLGRYLYTSTNKTGALESACR